MDGGNLKVNDKFNSFKALEDVVEIFEKNTLCCFYKREAVTIKQARKRGIKRPIKDSLKYYYLRYCCCLGGRPYTANAKDGIRARAAFQVQCTAYFTVKISNSGKYLYISDMQNTHNHRNTKELYNTFPKIKKKIQDSFSQ